MPYYVPYHYMPYGMSVSTVTQTRNLTVASSQTLDQTQLSGTTIDNYGQSATMTLTLEEAAAGLYFVLIVSTPSFRINVDPNVSNSIVLDGTTLTAGNKVSNITPVTFDYISFFSAKNASGVYQWIANSGTGLWADGGA